ncbi:MAG: hypothetical protein R3336_05870 [Phycisphaeraceae bacterium]|nr:hypothetical protein [Phycisphaeraceae bacterium]
MSSPHFSLLAQTSSREANQWLRWLRTEPQGQMVAIALLLVAAVVAMVICVIVFNSLRPYIKRLSVLTVAVAGALGAVWLLEPSTSGWVVMAVILFGMLIGYALFLTRSE